MKSRAATANNRRKAFEVGTPKGELLYPFAKLEARPTGKDPVAAAWVDRELGSQRFTYRQHDCWSTVTILLPQHPETG
jgi:hypothetical protein